MTTLEDYLRRLDVKRTMLERTLHGLKKACKRAVKEERWKDAYELLNEIHHWEIEVIEISYKLKANKI